MKKILLFSSAVALLAASCSDEFDNGLNSGPAIEYKSKIHALYESGLDTRTSLEATSTGYVYTWDTNDAVGVFQANEDGDDDTNAPFNYIGDGTFGGQYLLPQGNDYYGYYPYANGTEVTNNEITLTISPTQVYDFVSNQDPQGNRASGSFAQFAAPAVAMGSVVEDNNLDMTFKAVASYLTFPVIGYSTISSVQLQLFGESDPYNIAGNFSVNIPDFVNAVVDGDNATALTAINNTTLNAPTITLKCGKGVTLSQDAKAPTYFWFVVPANLTVYKAEITIIDNEGGKNTYTADFSTAPKTTPLNGVARIWEDSATNTPFEYTPAGSFYITTPMEFLEYANLVTKGVNAIATDYNALLENPKQLALSSLTQMLSSEAFNEDGELETSGFDASWVNNAIVLNDLDFLIVKTELGSSGSAYYELAPYFDYLQTYVASGMVPMGGTYAFDLSAINLGSESEPDYAALQNLNVNGNGIFGGATSTSVATVSNITLENVKVEGSYFIAANLFVNNATIKPSNIIVTEGCTIDPEPGSLFNETSASMLNSYSADLSTFPVVNQSEIPFVNNFRLNTNFNFTSFVTESGEKLFTPESFNTMSVTNQAGNVATVFNKADAITVISKATKPVGFGYSVVDNATSPTSYWTGTTYAASGNNFYAENLAEAVQSENTTNSTLTMNLDLMGGNGGYWWINKATVANNVKGANFEISNVYINGTSDGETAVDSPYLSLLGFASSATNLTVNNITIVNTGEDAIAAAQIGAIASWPMNTYNSSVVVNGMTVNADEAYSNGVGGIYSYLSTSNIDRINSFEITNFNTPTLAEGMVWGGLAGQMQYEVAEAVYNVPTYSNIGKCEYPLFGQIQFTFNTGEIMGTNLNFGANETIPELSFVAKNVKDGFTVFIYKGTTLVYTYQYLNKTWVKKNN